MRQHLAAVSHMLLLQTYIFYIVAILCFGNIAIVGIASFLKGYRCMKCRVIVNFFDILKEYAQ
jgi:hypothetical protein